ncbi:MAG: dTDP-4-dehydrorhamnose 3,5-epimerase [Gammaproteobacteria bacterium]|nr:dTDP-4-dehydrorhamnose 3,5-epimerase [Gammaproteobacteria bacterium]
MIFHKTPISGAYKLELESIADERGYFARAWCQKEFTEKGLCADFVQSNVSFNLKAGTLRGMHFQTEPYQEIKLVRCTQGAIYDVIVDLRKASDTYLQWYGVELKGDGLTSLYIPKGVAHGFQTLLDDSVVLYMHSEYYVADASSGVRWDDPKLNIKWPDTEKRIISKKDNLWLPIV